MMSALLAPSLCEVGVMANLLSSGGSTPTTTGAIVIGAIIVLFALGKLFFSANVGG